MAVTARWYASGLDHILSGDTDLLTATLKGALVISAYSPDADADEFWDSGGSGVGQDETSGTGYTAGGAALVSRTVTVVLSTGAPNWVASTVYDVGDVVAKPTDNGRIYRCIVAGTSAGSEPTFPTNPGETVTDNTVTWEEYGTSFVKFDAVDLIWTPNTTITARYLVVYDVGITPGTDDYVLCYLDFGQDESSVSGDFEIQFHPDVGIVAVGVES